ncbi:hypothetical protein BBJ28_00017265 [Nothophytophthora sp. Chile5]|nr:hypothetical protein BBJ28_00017265 [Nothophytophthora sp. Chile5]
MGQQFAGPAFASTTAPLTTSSRRSNTTSTTSVSDSSGGSSLSSASGSASSNKAGSDDSSGSESSGSDGSAGDDSGSWVSGSDSSIEYGCNCRSVRRVSLMGASDYCLAPDAQLSSKCGNIQLGEGGACPSTGAQPCSTKGHVLANDSLCALDDKDDTYKCVASKNDLEIQKHGGKKKKKRSAGGESGDDSSVSLAPPHQAPSALQVLGLVVSVAVGIMAVA